MVSGPAVPRAPLPSSPKTVRPPWGPHVAVAVKPAAVRTFLAKPPANVKPPVVKLAANPRMHTPYKDERMDGFADYNYNSVFDAAWALAGILPTTVQWASRLEQLYKQLVPRAFSVNEPLEIARRWHADPNDAEALKYDESGMKYGYIGPYASVRMGLGKLALSSKSSLVEVFLASDDIGLRCAAYSSSRLKEAQMAAGLAKDSITAFDEMVKNDGLWRTAGQRKILHDAAWGFKDDDMVYANYFRAREREMAKAHPDWFRDEEDQPDLAEETPQPATSQDVSNIGAAHENALAAVRITMAQFGKQLRWVLWLSMGAFVLALARHF